VSLRETSFSDVCGTIDELKRLMHEERERVRASPNTTIEPLLEDALFMLDRMRERLEQYKDFREKIRDILFRLDQIKDVDLRRAEKAADVVRGYIEGQGELRKSGLGVIDEAAEAIRTIAGNQENRLRTYKDLALQLHDQFTRIKGDRPWLVTEDETGSLIDNLSRKYQAWLPPEPHCGLLLKAMAESRAWVAAEALDDGQPVIQFEDGGVIPMSQVRWDSTISNFHPASFKPGPTRSKHR